MTDIQPKSRGMVKDSAKLLLRNVIRHTDTHNRLAEEAEMWKVYQRMQEKGRDERDDSPHADTDRKRKRETGGRQGDYSFRDPDVKNSFLYDDRQVIRGHNSSGKFSKGRAHMDFYDSDADASAVPLSAKSTYWMRQLEKAEAADEDRWGHAGYKELYPHDFKSDRSASGSSSSEQDSDSDGDDDGRRRKKRRKSRASSSDKRRLKRKKEKKKKLEKRRRNSDEQSDSDSNRKSKKKRKRHKRDDESDSSSKEMKRSKKDKESHRKKKRRK